MPKAVKTHFSPRNLSWILTSRNTNLESVNNEESSFMADSALELSVGRVVLKHINHVLDINEWIVDVETLDSFLEGSAKNKTTDTSESVDAFVRM
jgi:hypothetical protein